MPVRITVTERGTRIGIFRGLPTPQARDKALHIIDSQQRTPPSGSATWVAVRRRQHSRHSKNSRLAHKWTVAILRDSIGDFQTLDHVCPAIPGVADCSSSGKHMY